MFGSRLCSLAIGLIAAVIVFATSSHAAAHSYHTPNVCSTTATDICAHSGFATQPDSTEEAPFMLHFTPAEGIDATLVTNVSVVLWMDMGAHSHKGAPVEVNQLDDVHFEVTKANFFMTGPWLIKVSFDYDGATHELAIPVDVL